MPLWGNTDAASAKPKFPAEKLAEVYQAPATASQTQNNAVITINSASAVFAAELGTGVNVAGNNIVAGAYVTAFDTANGTITLNANTTANVITGDVLSFSNTIQYHANTTWATYNADTVLVTTTRLANAVFANSVNYSSANLANSGAAAAHTGWVHVTTGTGGRAGRVQVEVLVALSNTVASNTNSGNTSNSTTLYTGL